MPRPMLTAFLPGFALGFSLILAIGAQNAFVLRQGLRQSHVFAICLTCALSDAALIAAGVAGFSVLIAAAPWIGTAMLVGGVAFLAIYGTLSFRRAWQGGETLANGGETAGSLRAAVLTCLALTWLNPHVYLDTVVLLGSVSTQYASPWVFGSGAMTASFVFFFALGYGARLLSPLFAKPAAWRVLEVIVGCTMWALALKLLLT